MSGASEVGDGVRLAELVAALSLGIDLGFGQPMEHVLRQCRIALRIAELMGMDTEERSTVYYSALLVNVACHTDAHEQAKWYGDDIRLKSTKYGHEPNSLSEVLAMIRGIGSGQAFPERLRTGLTFLANLPHVTTSITTHARLAQQFARDLRLPEDVCDAVGSSYEWWNGKGWPGERAGESIPVAARVSTAAEYLEVAHRTHGVEAAVALATKRSGRMFDPAVSAIVTTAPDEVFGAIDATPSWRAVIEGEPSLTMRLDGEAFEEALAAIADFVDLKSPFMVGHSRAVASLAADAGRAMGLDPPEIDVLRRAGLVQGFGRLGVSNSIWDKRGPLATGEWERVRMYPYLTERMLHQSESLAAIGRVAVTVRERLDGSGYPRGVQGNSLPPAARVLGAADAYQAMREPRPHREPLSTAAIERELRSDVKAGRADAAAVEAVLAAAGHQTPRRREGVAGLTAREVEVLTLIAQGMSNRQIAERLVISPKTAGNHIEHVYAKIGATNRAAASLFAVHHGLLPLDRSR